MDTLPYLVASSHLLGPAFAGNYVNFVGAQSRTSG